MIKIKVSTVAAQVSQAAKRKPKKKKTKKYKTDELLSSGSTLINLACTNNPFGAFPIGKYSYIVGDSSSGKTFLSMTSFAESLLQERFKNYRLIYDNVEDGMNINLERLFNADVAQKVEPPAMTKDGQPDHSYMIEDFYYNLDDAFIRAKKEERPFIYILDSMDGLTSEAEVDKFNEHKKAHRKGTKAAGSYGDGKAKKNSEGLRKMQRGLSETESILIIISQTRDNLGFGFKPKTRSGGHALKFYATISFWSSVAGSIKKTINGKKRKIGNTIKVKMEKNRVTGEDWHEVQMDIYPTYGIDDIGSCVDFLVKENWWPKPSQTIDAKEFEIKGARDKIINHIEENGLYRKLQIITEKCWNELRKEARPKRKKRY